ncbi:hypothetical protein [Nocardiopsis changdeensis]|uniref:hypothetical protein n=1 Tax=Nocardiopsis changdeensis TaxID=2831969 RepID=UPI003F475B66
MGTSLLGGLPTWLQLLMMSYTIISGMSLMVIFTIRSAVEGKTDKSKNLLLNGPTQKDQEKNRKFPGTDTRINSMGIVPKKELDELQRTEQKMKSELRPMEEETRLMKVHATNTASQSTLLEGILKRFDGAAKDGDALAKAVDTEAATAATAERTGLVVVRGNNQGAALRSARQNHLPNEPGRGRGARPSP